jgi:hypothetical protein
MNVNEEAARDTIAWLDELVRDFPETDTGSGGDRQSPNLNTQGVVKMTEPNEFGYTPPPEATAFQYKDLPDEEVMFTGEQSRIYDKMPPGNEYVKKSNLNTHLVMKFADALRGGHLGETAMHYANQLEGEMDQPSVDRLKQLAREAHANRFDDAAVEKSFKQIREFVNGCKIVRRAKEGQ